MENQASRNRLSTLWKASLSVLGIIFLGALGSGLWELFLKNLLFAIANGFVFVATYIYSGYADRLYAEVGYGNYKFILFPSAFIFLICQSFGVFLYFVIYRFWNRYIVWQQTIPDRPRRVEDRLLAYLKIHKRVRHLAFLIPSLLILILYTDMLIISVSNFRTFSALERRIEIIRPYIENQAYLILLSQLRQIDNKAKAEKMVNRLEELFEQKNITIPELKLFGIQNKLRK